MLLQRKKYCKIDTKYIILQKNIFMNLKEQKNGNDQLNSIRNEFNNRISSTKFMGNSKRMKFNQYRRFRTI